MSRRQTTFIFLCVFLTHDGRCYLLFEREEMNSDGQVLPTTNLLHSCFEAFQRLICILGTKEHLLLHSLCLCYLLQPYQ